MLSDSTVHDQGFVSGSRLELLYLVPTATLSHSCLCRHTYTFRVVPLGCRCSTINVSPGDVLEELKATEESSPVSSD